MNHPRTAVLLIALLLSACTMGHCAGTPEGTLEEIISTDQMDVIIQHLPDSIAARWKTFSAKEKAEVAEEFLISKRMTKEGIKLQQTAADEWEILETKGEQKDKPVVRIKLKNSFVTGLDALIVLEAHQVRDDAEQKHDDRAVLALVSMQLQDGEWRIMQVGGGELRNVEDILGSIGPSPAASEASAVGGLRTLNTALITYQATYPDVGFAPSVAALGGNTQTEPSAERARLIDTNLASGVKSGYKFTYTRVSASAYTITARPVEFGKTGTRSFFTDQSCVIRYTAEDREPNAGDEAL